ncbi:MAG: 4Fe-4S binding protein, partial [Candidatus Zixiibacteriota bacterium]
RHPVPTIPVERRMGVSEVELGFPAEVAIQEGKRCLRCNINTIFNGEKCILCGGCVDVCPMDCLKMVRLNQLEGDENLAKLILARYGLPKERFDQNQDLGTAMIKDETACIRCGLCADRCPTDAITMELFELEEIVDE